MTLHVVPGKAAHQSANGVPTFGENPADVCSAIRIHERAPPSDAQSTIPRYASIVRLYTILRVRQEIAQDTGLQN